MEPTPPPSTGTGTTVPLDAWLGSLAVLAGVLTLAVIVAGLVFASKYHNRVLALLHESIRLGYASQNDDAHAYDAAVAAAPPPNELEISGPASLLTDQAGKYVVVSPAGDTTYTWNASTDGEPLISPTSEPTLTCRFGKKGSHTISVSSRPNNPDEAGNYVEKTGSITVAVTEPIAVGKSISVPFAIGNWGRFVVTTLGVGLISVMILARVLDGGSGIGVLGTLLGVGVAGATTGALRSKDDTEQESDPDVTKK